MTGQVRLNKLATYLLIPVIVWMLFTAFAPLFFNGTLYHIASPAKVEIEGGVIYITLDRTSKIDASATHYTRIVCGGVEVLYTPKEGGIHAGEAMIRIPRPIISSPNGECVIRGLMEYQPFSNIGPVLTHEWHSEPFIIP